MWMDKEILLIEMFLALFPAGILGLYLDIFFSKSPRKIRLYLSYMLFFIWQFFIAKINLLPGYMNISITVVLTIIVVVCSRTGKFWNKCVVGIAFNAIWMLMETLCASIFMLYFTNYMTPRLLGSFISKLMLLIVILLLRKVFTDDGIKELSTGYSITLMLIPIGSIYIMNSIFTLSSHINAEKVSLNSFITVVILLLMNILIFYMYMKLADELQLKRCNSVYQQQLELCERHQNERELSMLQLRDARHNMRNSLISILAYAEDKDYDKMVAFVEETMEEGGLNFSAVSQTGNIVIDSLVNYWFTVAEGKEITFKMNFHIPMQMSFRGADLCLILGNLLENAVEAAENAIYEKRILLNLKYDKENLFIFVENTYNGNLVKTKSGRLKTTKPDSINHGIGLESVNRIVKKHNGTVIIDDGEAYIFRIKILLYAVKK